MLIMKVIVAFLKWLQLIEMFTVRTKVECRCADKVITAQR